MKPSRTNRWMSATLRSMARFQRVAAWPDSPRLRFLLRHSPVHWMRERLWLMARLEPRIQVVNRNLTSARHISYASTAPLAIGIVHRNSIILRHLHDREAQAAPPLLNYERAEGARVRVAAPAVATLSAVRLAPQPFARHEVLPRSVVHGPLAVRLGERASRVDNVPVNVPTRVVRGSSALSAAAAAHGFQRTDSSPARGSGPRSDAPFASPVAPVPATPVNVEQLTSEVLRQLDRRLIASRERMGRI